MAPRILIQGPHGAGKSTLVLQIMQQYERRIVVSGGVGLLPLGYLCESPGCPPMVVLGNYEATSRDRFGMQQFERYRSNFVTAIEFAMKAECPVLMEGGFTKPRRLETEAGKRFCYGLQVVWLEPIDTVSGGSLARNSCRDQVTDSTYLTSRARAVGVTSVMTKNGAVLKTIEDRRVALGTVAQLIGLREELRLCDVDVGYH